MLCECMFVLNFMHVCACVVACKIIECYCGQSCLAISLPLGHYISEFMHGLPSFQICYTLCRNFLFDFYVFDPGSRSKENKNLKVLRDVVSRLQ